MKCRKIHWGAARLLLVLGLILGLGRATAAAPAALEDDNPLDHTVWLPFVAKAPPYAERSVIGYSVAGRPLHVYRFGDGPRTKLILGGIHGGYEWNTIDLVRELMQAVLANPQLVPPGQTLYFLPVLNPDGEARSRWIEGRANENLADINRNFDDNWQSDWYREGCWNYLPINAGTAPFSEPEAAALRDFILTHQVEALISYHSAGAEIYAGGVPPDPTSLDLALTLAGAGGYAYPPRATTCEFTGQMIDWASAQGTAALDVEMAEHQAVDYAANRRMLQAFLHWSPPAE